MSLAVMLNALAEAEPVGRGPQCTLGVLLLQLSEEDAQALRAVLDNPKVSAVSLAEALGRSGHGVNAPTVRRHRRRGTGDGCRCPR